MRCVYAVLTLACQSNPCFSASAFNIEAQMCPTCVWRLLEHWSNDATRTCRSQQV